MMQFVLSIKLEPVLQYGIKELTKLSRANNIEWKALN